MVFIDYILILILLISTAISLFRGFLKEAISLAAWVIAVWVAWRFGGSVAAGLEGSIDSMTARIWAARGMLMIVVLVGGGLFNWLVSFLLQKSGLSGTDRAIGMLFGFARGVVLAGVLVAVLQVAGYDSAAWWGESKLIPYAAPVADMLRGAAEEGIEYLDSDEF